jgi:hypothetical protein
MFNSPYYNARDALRALREHGPMDRVIVTTRCLKCGEEVIQPLRWLHEHEMLCSCGGEFDSKPIVELILFLGGRRKSPPESIRVVPDVEEES